jgi:hypothetical protein
MMKIILFSPLEMTKTAGINFISSVTLFGHTCDTQYFRHGMKNLGVFEVNQELKLVQLIIIVRSLA